MEDCIWKDADIKLRDQTAFMKLQLKNKEERYG